MAEKFTTYRGHDLSALKSMDVNEFMKLVPSRTRRSLKRGFTDEHKKFIAKVKKAAEAGSDKMIKTHCRDLPVLPVAAYVLQISR